MGAVRALLHTEFAPLLARADVSQAAFARVSGYTPRQVNNWARGRAAAPSWAISLAAVLQQTSPEAPDLDWTAAAASHATLPLLCAVIKTGRVTGTNPPRSCSAVCGRAICGATT